MNKRTIILFTFPESLSLVFHSLWRH